MNSRRIYVKEIRYRAKPQRKVQTSQDPGRQQPWQGQVPQGSGGFPHRPGLFGSGMLQEDLHVVKRREEDPGALQQRGPRGHNQRKTQGTQAQGPKRRDRSQALQPGLGEEAQRQEGLDAQIPAHPPHGGGRDQFDSRVHQKDNQTPERKTGGLIP